MAQQTYAWVLPVVAVTVWLFGVVILGTHWEGVEAAPGVWRDGVSMQRWSVCWAGLFAMAAIVAPWVPRWRQRGLALVPLLVWLAVELRHGSLAPVAWLVYAVPTAVVWLLGTWVGDRVGHPLARGVKQNGA